MKTIVQFLLHVFFPTAIGTCVYVGWRSTDLLVFRWIEYCGLNALVTRPTIDLTHWLLYSLPDGCWVYAATSWMLIIWKRLVPWTWIAVVLAVAAEFGQLFGWIQGSYATLDVIFYIGGFLLAGVLNEKTSLVDTRHTRYGFLGIGQH